MPRIARIKSASDIYHIMIRGNNRQTIFHDSEDADKFLSFLFEKRNKGDILIYAWCIMPNHVHLLIKKTREPLDTLFRSVLTGFVLWYNAKYKRVGHLFQGRYKSQAVENETYFLRTVRYIHRNPVAAGLCERMEDYPYSSFSSYFRSGKYQDEDLIFHMIRKDEFEQYHLEADEHEDDFPDIDNIRGRISNEKLEDLVLRSGVGCDLSGVNSLPRERRGQVIQMMLRSGASYRQINQLTGISMSVIRAVSKELRLFGMFGA